MEVLIYAVGHKAWDPDSVRAVDAHSVFDGFTRILDFYHATEHLSTAAEHLFEKPTARAAGWYRDWRNKLRHQPGATRRLDPFHCLSPAPIASAVGASHPGDQRAGLLP